MLQSVYARINNQPMREDLTWLGGGGGGNGILNTLNQALRRKKACHKGIFGDLKVI